MQYQQYRNGIFKMWEYLTNKELSVIEIETGTSENDEFFYGGLCNPEFNCFSGRDNTQQCPFDIRSEKDIDEKPCLDNCQIFTKGLQLHKLQIIMSKFMSRFVTSEGITSLKSLAKACRGQKGTSKEAAKDFINIAEKVKKSTERFGGYEFAINNGRLSVERRND
jgi:hypothetical protein